MKIAWLTDIHLNVTSEEIRSEFYNQIVEAVTDIIIISGDIAEATNFVSYLKEMADAVQIPIYFVLGNHDYYNGSVDEVRAHASQLNAQCSTLHYLSSMDPVEIGPHIFLVGQDGWADARAGKIESSRFMMNDTRLIKDLQSAFNTGASVTEWFTHLVNKMQELADKDAVALAEQLQKATNQDARHIYIVTHIPPFTASCVGEDIEQYGCDSVYPYFVSVVMGEVLTRFATQHPEVQFTVYCGHTHSPSTYQAESNLMIHCEGAQYKKPVINQIHDIDLEQLAQNSRIYRM